MSRHAFLGTFASMMAVAGCTTAGAPVQGQQMVNRMAAVLTVLSPLVDLLPGLGLSAGVVAVATRSFNTARDAAVAASSSPGGVQPEHLDQFVDHAQRVIVAITPALVESGRVSIEQMQEISATVAILPALSSVTYTSPARAPSLVPAVR